MYTKSVQYSQLLKKVKSLDFDEEPFPEFTLLLMNMHLRGAVGILMTNYLVKLLGNDEQAKEWAPKISNRDWIACYAQTELGHGSDVQSLKTIATFDQATQEFIIHSPDIESIKWWPGELGLSATHGVVMARIITNGKDHGVFPLFIQLRDLKTHKVLPGLEI
jgi:acyl-CoA oxidase